MRKGYHHACAVGIIGSADGPTTVQATRTNQAQWRETLARCKERIKPRDSRATGAELVRFLKEEYGACEIPASNGERRALRMSAWMNHHPEAAAQAVSLREVMNKADEAHGLSDIFLAVPRNEKTERLYAAVAEETAPPRRFWKRRWGRKKPPVREKVMTFGIEMSTGYFQLHDGCKALVDEVTLWRGVTREDIEKETPEFLAYAAALRDTGRL